MSPSERSPELYNRDTILSPNPDNTPVIVGFLLAAATHEVIAAGFGEHVARKYSAELGGNDYSRYVRRSVNSAAYCRVASNRDNEISGMIAVFADDLEDHLVVHSVLPNRDNDDLKGRLLEQYFLSPAYSSQKAVLVEVIDTDFATQNFYRSYGFKRYRLQPTDDPFNLIVMRLEPGQQIERKHT